MKVTERSCRDRVSELLKSHRQNELESLRASGISEEETTELENLLTSISKLQEAKLDKKVKALYSRKDQAEAQALRATALIEVRESDSSGDEDSFGKQMDPKAVD
ncbi:unnamed protein product, partial [Allacma fusca]